VREARLRLRCFRQGNECFEIPNDFVLVLTGYHPDYRLLESMGIRIEPESGEPEYDPDTMETNVSSLYIAGGIAAGRQANKIFIENGRLHGSKIVAHIVHQS
jgi:thioredoxin reductase (NADPH)